MNKITVLFLGALFAGAVLATSANANSLSCPEMVSSVQEIDRSAKIDGAKKIAVVAHEDMAEYLSSTGQRPIPFEFEFLNVYHRPNSFLTFAAFLDSNGCVVKSQLPPLIVVETMLNWFKNREDEI